MRKNLDTKGRIIRLVIGLIFLTYAWWQSSWIALACALFTFYEALASWCIIYYFLGISTCPINKTDKNK